MRVYPLQKKKKGVSASAYKVLLIVIQKTAGFIPCQSGGLGESCPNVHSFLGEGLE